MLMFGVEFRTRACLQSNPTDVQGVYFVAVSAAARAGTKHT